MASKSQLSEEKVQDSSDEESSSSEVDQQSVDKFDSTSKTSKSKPSALDKLMDDTSSSGSDASEDESDASKASSKSSRSSANTGTKRKATEPPKRVSDSPVKKHKTSISNVKGVEPATYAPPQGYTANKMQATEITSQAQSIFKDLTGKQVWRISAPASFPMSKLESLDVQAALSGKPILEHKGVSFTLSRADLDDSALLTPKPNGDYVYTADVAHTYNITGRSNVATKSNGQDSQTSRAPQSTQNDSQSPAPSLSTVFFATKTGQKMTPRTQPDNLKARYVPYGVIAGSYHTELTGDAGEDVPMTDVSSQPAEQTQDPPQSTPKASKKSRTEKPNSSQVESTATPSKRQREKHVGASSQESAIPESSQKRKKEKSKK